MYGYIRPLISPFVIVIQVVNNGSLAMTISSLSVTRYTESDCQVDPFGVTFVYADDMEFIEFKSFELSRSLGSQEQLDVNRGGQDPGQDQTWPCGEYITDFRVGTLAGCQNVPNGGTATCVRLWHY